jgi:hypothetical protein
VTTTTLAFLFLYFFKKKFKNKQKRKLGSKKMGTAWFIGKIYKFVLSDYPDLRTHGWKVEILNNVMH